MDEELRGEDAFDHAQDIARDMPRMRDLDAIRILADGTGYGVVKGQAETFLFSKPQARWYFGKMGWGWSEYELLHGKLGVRNRAVSLIDKDEGALVLRGGNVFPLASAKRKGPILGRWWR